MRKVISDMLNQDPRIHVIGTARNGEDALRKRKQLRPDVMTLDVEMPIMNGLETLKHVMNDDPCPVVMISSTTKQGAENTLLAMEYGAVDFVTKPSGAISLDIDRVENEIVEKVVYAARARLRRSSPKPIIQPRETQFATRQKRASSSPARQMIAIGTSTGGPKALKDVITKLPGSLKAPVLIVQHMPAGFTRSLAERLDSLSEITVKEAENGDVLQDGIAYIAPGGYHLSVREQHSSYVIETHLEEPRRGHRPAVDVMYESLAAIDDIETIAVIMTGMGADGSEGLMKLKQSGSCYAIAEAEESCVVFGMPKVAIRTKLVDEVVHIQEIAGRIIRQVH
ncbi:chemotaxis response regulator protein-glutamate methylesterase [Alkalihalobacillus oceani]|nr:chemotaxis response regulator protein-glutamate methylesterase [Halalkalibacter oceani]